VAEQPEHLKAASARATRTKMKQIIYYLIGILFFVSVYSTNASILYGWNGSNVLPLRTTSDGKLMIDLNMLNVSAYALFSQSVNTSQICLNNSCIGNWSEINKTTSSGSGTNTSPALPNRAIQFNNNGTFGGASELTLVSSSSGTAISSCQDLQNIKNNVAGSYYLTQNVDCGIAPWNNGTTFKPIGNYSANPFTGTLDGNGFNITNLFINKSGYVGLFEMCSGAAGEATIREVNLIDINFIGDSYIGGFSAYSTYPCNIYNSKVTGNFSSTATRVGGLIGRLGGFSGCSGTQIANIQNVYTKIKMIRYNQEYTGGLIGESKCAYIDSCYTDITIIDAVGRTGGLIGQTANTGYIKNSYANVNITNSSYYTGGLVGTQGVSTFYIKDSYATGIIRNTLLSSTNTTGGLVGSNSGAINNSFWNGTYTIMPGYAFFGIAGETSGILYNVWYNNNSDVKCALNVTAGGIINCTGIKGDGSYFYNQSTEPLSRWDFTTKWQSINNSFPRLIPLAISYLSLVLQGDLTVSGSTTIGNALTVSQSQTIGGNLAVAGSITTGGTFYANRVEPSIIYQNTVLQENYIYITRWGNFNSRFVYFDNLDTSPGNSLSYHFSQQINFMNRTENTKTNFQISQRIGVNATSLINLYVKQTNAAVYDETIYNADAANLINAYFQPLKTENSTVNLTINLYLSNLTHGTNKTGYQIYVESGNVYVTDNITAKHYTDHTPAFPGTPAEALKAITSITASTKSSGVKEIDHNSLPALAQAKIPSVDRYNCKNIINTQTRPDGTEENTTSESCDFRTIYSDGRDIGGLESVMTDAIKALDANNKAKDSEIAALQAEVTALKISLCKAMPALDYCRGIGT
jgi:hypothetical protein